MSREEGAWAVTKGGGKGREQGRWEGEGARAVGRGGSKGGGKGRRCGCVRAVEVEEEDDDDGRDEVMWVEENSLGANTGRIREIARRRRSAKVSEGQRRSAKVSEGRAKVREGPRRSAQVVLRGGLWR